MTDDGQGNGDAGRMSLRDRLVRLVGGAPALPHDRNEPPAASVGEMGLRIREFERALVRDVMISRVDIAAIDVETSMADALKIFAEEAHSRMPVYRESLDKPLGFVHLKDLVAELVRSGDGADRMEVRPLERLIREILFVPESMRLPDLLLQMQTKRMHLAMVIDEYGGAAGLVSLEDLVEQIVGDIEDEHDDAAPMIVRRGRNIWEADGLANVSSVERDTGFRLMLPAYRDEIDTIGGLATAIAGRVPKAGDQISHPGGFQIEVVAADPRRITRLRIRPSPQRSAAPPLAAGDPGAVERSIDSSG